MLDRPETRLQAQKLAKPFKIDKWTIEAGPTYFEGAAAKVSAGIQTAAGSLATRTDKPYSTAK